MPRNRRWGSAAGCRGRRTGEWAFLESMNVTSMGSGRRYLAAVRADAVAIQETRLDGGRVAEQSASLGRQGWHFVGIPAVPKQGGLSGGARRHVDMWYGDDKELWPGRLLVVYLRLPVLGALVLYNVYLECGVGIGGQNGEILMSLFRHSLGHSLPWLAVGDGNNTPEELGRVEFLRLAGVSILAPTDYTCDSGGARRVLDYGLAGRHLGKALLQPRVDCDIAMATHRPVLFCAKEKAVWPVVRTIGSCALPSSRPCGPAQRPPDWRHFLDDAAGLLERLREVPCGRAERQRLVD